MVAIILPLVLLADAVVLFAAYNISKNNAIENCKNNVRQAAVIASQYFEFVDPSDLNEAKTCSTIFNQLCDTMDMAYIYTERIYPEQGKKQYLSLGFGNDAVESAKEAHSSGSFSEVVLDEEIAAQNENKTCFLEYDNQFGHTIVCLTPVKKHISRKVSSDKDSSVFVNETLSIAVAELSVRNILESLQYEFRRIFLYVVLSSVLIVFLISFIIYQRITKPLRKISHKMSAFLDDRGEDFKPLVIKGKNELSEMADSFNTMAQEIDSYIENISELNREKAMQETELNIARNIQMGFLEPADFESIYANIHATMLPAKDVGGDLYDYQVLSNGNICIIIADVSGKGVSAALFMANAITLLRHAAESGLSPDRIMTKYNDHLAKHNPNMMFITTFIGIYHPSTGEFFYSNAGHNPPYLLSDSLMEIESMYEVAAGIFGGEAYTEKCLRLKPGDTVFLYTDGVTEAKSAGNELYGDDRLKQILSGHLHEPGEAVMNTVLDDIREFSDKAVQNDDITILTFTIPSENSITLHLDAVKQNMETINKHISSLAVDDDIKAQLRLIAEEMFVNICSYAYENGSGKAEVSISADSSKVTLTFTDSGKPFDPTKNIQDIEEYDPENRIGSLGRFLTFELADSYSYKYEDGKNKLTIFKNI